MAKKYPIGTKIRFIGAVNRKRGDFMYEDAGKEGSIVGISGSFPIIYLPKSEYISCFSTIEIPATVQCGWSDIEPLILKGQQLLFAFMEQEDGR